MVVNNGKEVKLVFLDNEFRGEELTDPLWRAHRGGDAFPFRR